MMGNGGLAKIQRFGEIADASFTAVGGLDDGEQAQPVGVRQRFEHHGPALCFLSAKAGDSRRAARGLRIRFKEGQRGHLPIMSQH